MANRRLAAGAIVAGVGGLALVALGWWVIDWQYRSDWGRLNDDAWWGSVLLRGLGELAFSAAGLKVGLALVAAVAGAGMWLTTRKKKRPEQAAD